MRKSWMRAVAAAVIVSAVLITGRPAQAGGGDETLVGFLFGTSAGLVLGGAVTIFYRNPDSDRNITTILLTGSLIGAVVGTAWGMSLPDDAFEKDPVVSMSVRDGLHCSLSVPDVSLYPVAGARSDHLGGHASLLDVKF